MGNILLGEALPASRYIRKKQGLGMDLDSYAGSSISWVSESVFLPVTWA